MVRHLLELPCQIIQQTHFEFQECLPLPHIWSGKSARAAVTCLKRRAQTFWGLAGPASAGLGAARRSVPWLECGAEKWKLLSPVLKQPRPQQRQYEDFSESELLLRLRGEAEA